MAKIIAERYELLELIGQGGMADVYLAQDIILNRTIAIKILRTSLAKDPIYVTRFQREASAAAALSHKNIVEIYDVGEDEDKYYIVWVTCARDCIEAIPKSAILATPLSVTKIFCGFKSRWIIPS